MNSKYITPKTTELNLNPLGFYRYAEEYLKVANSCKIQESFSPVPYFLFCISIEIALKAYLLTKKVTLEELKKDIGHDLEKALKKGITLDLDEVIKIKPNYNKELHKANLYYPSTKGKGFEYFQATRAIRGYPHLPKLEVLSEFANDLVTRLESVCSDAE